MKFSELEQIFSNKNALEIGGPSSLLNSFYTHLEQLTVLNYEPAMTKHSQVGNSPVIYGDATNEDILTQLDEKYDLLITSHTLEHIANPIKALKIWKQLLKTGGTILSIVPCKHHCWDKARSYTTLSHLIKDYMYNTLESDLTHVHESNCMIETRPNYYNDVGVSNDARVIHHHVYSKSILSEMHSYAGFKQILSDNIEDDPLQLTYIGINE